MERTPELIRALLGCPLEAITRSYWAAKLKNPKGEGHEWVSEAHFVHHWNKGEQRPIDWMDDIAATNDAKQIVELWLLCPPSRTAPSNCSDFDLKECWWSEERDIDGKG